MVNTHYTNGVKLLTDVWQRMAWMEMDYNLKKSSQPFQVLSAVFCCKNRLKTAGIVLIAHNAHFSRNIY